MSYYEDDNPDDLTSMQIFVKNVLSTFVLLTVSVIAIALKRRLIKDEPTIFSSAAFVVIMTILVSVIGTTDQYVYNNTILGIGIALGFQLMNWKISE